MIQGSGSLRVAHPTERVFAEEASARAQVRSVIIRAKGSCWKIGRVAEVGGGIFAKGKADCHDLLSRCWLRAMVVGEPGVAFRSELLVASSLFSLEH